MRSADADAEAFKLDDGFRKANTLIRLRAFRRERRRGLPQMSFRRRDNYAVTSFTCTEL